MSKRGGRGSPRAKAQFPVIGLSRAEIADALNTEIAMEKELLEEAGDDAADAAASRKLAATPKFKPDDARLTDAVCAAFARAVKRQSIGESSKTDGYVGEAAMDQAGRLLRRLARGPAKAKNKKARRR